MRDTIAAAATAPGEAALAVVRLSGDGALAAALGILETPALEPRRATVCAARLAGPIDEVVATYFPGPRSATGEDLVEISCHGSPYVVRLLLDAALARGARPALPGEFTQRAFLNGRLDLAQAEAVGALIAARSAGAHRAALSQLRGGLSRRVRALREPVLAILARASAGLDHPEEDLPAASSQDLERACAASAAELRRLAATFAGGRAAREGARVALVGRPNAGKSSLFNRLVGRERAIVCEEPGTTRDTLAEPARFGVLIDTAGLREDAATTAERLGLARTEEALRECDAAVLVVDGSRPQDESDERAHRRILEQAAARGRPVVLARSKADLPSFSGGDGVAVSSVTGAGLAELERAIACRLPPPEPGDAVVATSARHERALAAAAGELELAAAAWGEDRAAHHLREALRRLDELTGAGAPDELLAEIFSRFCVGK